MTTVVTVTSRQVDLVRNLINEQSELLKQGVAITSGDYRYNVAYDYTEIKRMAAGVNYHPIPQIAIKAEYSHRFLKDIYNDEPSVNIGVAYEGWFL